MNAPPLLLFSVNELLWMLFTSFGIWFTLVCVFHMARTALQIVFSESPNRKR